MVPFCVVRLVCGVENDKQLNVVAITDPLGRAAETYVLDENERVVAVTNVEGQVMTREYLVGDIVASETRFDGSEVAYGYDTDGNQTSISYPGETLSFSYDGDGLMLSASNSVGVFSNEYGAATGWLTASVGADGTEVSYSRRSGGGVASLTSAAGTTSYAFDAAGRKTHISSPAGSFDVGYCDWNGKLAAITNANGFVVEYAYDIMDRVTNISWRTPSGATLGGFEYEYDAVGRIVSQRGATYPVDYAYDEFGDKVSMTTYRDINAAGDVTRWLRDEATGLVTNKVYADGKGPTYTYTPDGKLATRTWARGIVTTYSYDDNGSLTNTVYSDGTPTISLAYNRAGRQVRAEDAAGVTTFAYDDFGAVTNETVIGVAGTNTIERFYDNFGRDAGYALNGVRQSTLSYDSATGRLVTMLAAGSDTPFTWNYLVGSDLKSSLAYPNGLTASWQYDANGQLLQVRNATPTNTISQYDYTYDAAGRRVACGKSGCAFAQNDTLSYCYNEKSELTNAVAAVDSDYRYAYDFDDIGNRESSSERGTNSVCAANNLNQYTAITDMAATPSSSQTFQPQFDDDGNQTLIKTATGIWSVTYNGENRPILWSCIQSNNTNNQTILTMSYDRIGRRVVKNAQRFVYDGYLQIANFEFTSTNSQLTTHNPQLFVWDPTEPVATRPLVWNSSTFQPFNFSTSYYTHDGNKNVSEVIRSDGMADAHYEYAPFGMLTSMVGEFAFQNQWRFSSESSDDTLALLHYNYRDYSSALGRFLSRDHEIFQATNPYVFTKNSCINGVDVLGLEESTSFEDYMKLLASKNGYNDAEYDMDYIEFALAHGCVGVVWANIGYNPLKDIGRQEVQAYNKCFSTRARAVKEKTKFKDSNHCCKLEKGSTPRLYSIHFRNSKGQDGVNPKAKQPDSDGFVDLSNWRKKSRNFDFAFEDDNGRMVGASQFYDPDHSKFGESEDSSDSMIITRTQKEWSALISTSVINGIDLEMQFDTEVWCVACSQLSNFKKQTN